jgi:hypothetical protein
MVKLLCPPKLKFGSNEFFRNYLRNQIEKEGKTQEVIHRVHFAITSLILDNFKGKEAFDMIRNLTAACEELSEW